VEVYDNGGVWCGNDNRPFVPRSLQLKKRAAKARRKPKAKILVAPQLPIALRLPAAKVHLIRSVMADLGSPMPNRIKALNKALSGLLERDVIKETGEFNLDHPMLQTWLERMQKRKGKLPTKAASLPSTLLPNP